MLDQRCWAAPAAKLHTGEAGDRSVPHPAWCCVCRTDLNNSASRFLWPSYLTSSKTGINKNGDFKCVLSLIFNFFFLFKMFNLTEEQKCMHKQNKIYHDTSRTAISLCLQASQALLYTPPSSWKPHFQEEKLIAFWTQDWSKVQNDLCHWRKYNCTHEMEAPSGKL